MRTILSGLLALSWLVLTMTLPAAASDRVIDYKPGVLATAIKNGETVLLHYKTSW